MAKELKTHLDLQDRNNHNAEAIPDWKATLARNTRGADEANARHVARRHELAQRPTQNLRMISPLMAGKETVDTVEGQLNMGKGKK